MKKILHKWIEQYFGTEESLLLTVILLVSLIVFATLGAILGPVFAALIFSFLRMLDQQLQGSRNCLASTGRSYCAIRRQSCCASCHLIAQMPHMKLLRRQWLKPMRFLRACSYFSSLRL